MLRILYSSRFERKFRKLPWEVQERSLEKEQIFRADPFDSRLKTHKLQGSLAGYWSFSVGYSYRIIFRFVDENIAAFDVIGDHDIYEH